MNNRIELLRRAQNLKQSDLADICKVSQSTLSNWESGRHEPDYNAMSCLADFFGVSIDYLMGRDAKIPDAAEAAPGAEGKISMEEAGALLARLGFLKEGRELTEQDLALLGHVIGILDAHFGQ